jgi:signal transduction histidine kinase
VETHKTNNGTSDGDEHTRLGQAIRWLLHIRAEDELHSKHVWIILALIGSGAFLYYVDQTRLTAAPPFDHAFFTTVHDLHRTLFFIPVIYAAVAFRLRGALITSGAFLAVVLPRALLFSPYPDPVLRPLLFVFFATFIGVLLATQLDRVEEESRARMELSAAYGQLSEAYLRLQQTQEQLIHAEKLSSLGQLAASVAHEVNNPLSGVLVYNQLLAQKLRDNSISREQGLQYVSNIEGAVKRCTRLMTNLLDFAHQSSPAMSQVDVNSLLDASFSLLAHLPPKQNILVVREFGQLRPIMADADRLQQVFVNLLLNAIQAMPQGGTLTMRTALVDGHVKVEVEDTGCGISKENMRKLFTPFFTTKQERQGVGLGLAVAYGIIQQHGGRIDVQSEDGVGSTFSVLLPECPPQSTPGQSS